MRVLASSLFALVAAVPALADDVYTQAPVAAVTVYPNGAELLHRATVDLPAGTHKVFLPYAGLDDISALPRIGTSQGVSIGALGFQRDVAVDREALFTPAQAAAFTVVEGLEEQIALKDDEIATADALVASLEARLAFLANATPGEGMTSEALVAMATTIGQETQVAQAALVKAEAALRPLERTRDDLAEDLAAVKSAFDKLSPPDAVADVIAVALEVAEAGPVSLELSELTSEAWWEMDYDLDLDREAGNLAIARKLIVVQETGQAWSDVDLTLSTARPGEDVSPSPVRADLARIREPNTFARVAGAAADMMAEAPAPVAEPRIVEAEMKTASLEVDGLALSYVYPDAVSIVSGEAAELALDKLEVAAEVVTQASPRHDTTAFSVASFTNSTGEPILPGWANILRDGHLVGREHIEMIPAGGEAELGFGPIEGIRLATIFERNAEGDSGFISKSNTREQVITFTVENLTDEAQEVRTLFPLTFSEQEDLRVRVTATPQPDETDLDRQRGVSAWTFMLPPGETREVSIKVALDWPEGQELVWYP